MIEQYLTMDVLALILGIVGACLVGLNYILESLNKLGKDHKMFSWINLVSAILLLFNAFWNSVWVFVGLNLFLISIGVYGLYKVYFSPEKK
jgi:hypothetical protein